jgi:protein-S-isoprenylcysteine O-methyltransferase Ste14
LVDLRRGSPNRVLRESGTAESDNTGTIVGLILPVGVVSALLASMYHGDLIWGESWWPVVLGVALMMAGMALRRWSIRCLGQWFSIDIRIQDGQSVVRDGPYRWIRHPSYAGLIITAIGLGLALNTWASLAILAVSFVARFGWRIHNEERVLAAGLGEDYRSYQKSTARLVPGVW